MAQEEKDRMRNKQSTIAVASTLEKEELESVVSRAMDGDATVLDRLRQILDEHPEIWAHYGDLAVRAEARWLDMIASKNLFMKECVLRKLDAMRAELEVNSGSPLEALLAERVVATWMQMAYYEAAAAQNGQLPLAEREFLQKRVDRVQRRHLAAIKSLADVQRLLPITVPASAPGQPIELGAAADGSDGGQQEGGAAPRGNGNGTPGPGATEASEPAPASEKKGRMPANRIRMFAESLEPVP